MKTIEKITSLYLWIFYRKEWFEVDKIPIGRKRFYAGSPNNVVDLVEITWCHPKGYIRKQYVIR
jgi:hypothetical protein